MPTPPCEVMGARWRNSAGPHACVSTSAVWRDLLGGISGARGNVPKRTRACRFLYPVIGRRVTAHPLLLQYIEETFHDDVAAHSLPDRLFGVVPARAPLCEGAERLVRSAAHGRPRLRGSARVRDGLAVRTHGGDRARAGAGTAGGAASRGPPVRDVGRRR